MIYTAETNNRIFNIIFFLFYKQLKEAYTAITGLSNRLNAWQRVSKETVSWLREDDCKLQLRHFSGPNNRNLSSDDSLLLRMII